MTTVSIHVGEQIDPSRWSPLPVADRVLVGGTTAWLGPFDVPLKVAQPNRWGMAEPSFPAVPCVVESDPLVTGQLPLPADVVGWVDRAHRTIDPPTATSAGSALIAAAARLAKMLDQTKGVRLVGPPTARTVALTTPLEPADLIARCIPLLTGIRRLEGMAGAVAVVVTPDHSRQDLETIADVVHQAVTGQS